MAARKFRTILFKRMKSVSVEEAWAVMKNAGYGYQVAEGWQVINPDSVLVGRAVTLHLCRHVLMYGGLLIQWEKKRAREDKIPGQLIFW